jgi:hypothetical protein
VALERKLRGPWEGAGCLPVVCAHSYSDTQFKSNIPFVSSSILGKSVYRRCFAGCNYSVELAALLLSMSVQIAAGLLTFLLLCSRARGLTEYRFNNPGNYRDCRQFFDAEILLMVSGDEDASLQIRLTVNTRTKVAPGNPIYIINISRASGKLS